MNLETFSFSLSASNRYFIGPDQRIKFFPNGVDLISSDSYNAKPLGLVCIECQVSGQYLIQTFRIEEGADISQLTRIAGSPGVLSGTPSTLIFSESIRTTLNHELRRKIKSEFGLKSISFTKILSDKALNLSNHIFDVPKTQTLDCKSFLVELNINEYRKSIERTITSYTLPNITAEITDLRVASNVKLKIQVSDQIISEGIYAPKVGSRCIVERREGVLDHCLVLDSDRSHFQADDIFSHMHGSFGEDLFDDDDDDDFYDEDEDYEEDDVNHHNGEYGPHLLFDNRIHEILSVLSLSCCAHGWWDYDLSQDTLDEIMDCEDNLKPSQWHAINKLILSHGIYVDLDSENFIWPLSHALRNLELIGLMDLVPPRQVKGQPRYVVAVFEHGITHVYQIDLRRYDYDRLCSSLDYFGEEVQIDRLKIPAKNYSSIAQMVRLATTPEAMQSAVILITQILRSEVPEFTQYVDLYE